MQGIQPSGLTTEELLKYVWVSNFSVSPEWVQELYKRLEETLDDNK